MGILLAKSNAFLIGPIAEVLGYIMNLIVKGLHAIGIENGLIALSITLFTIIVYTLMLPLTVKQQKFTRISSVMNPEIQAIQKKYANKKDQASMMKMQEETKLVYEKYGTSPTGGCLGSLIQLPILFALWPVVSNIQDYVPMVKKNYDVYNTFLGIDMGVTPSKMLSDAWGAEPKNYVMVIIAVLIPLLAGFSQWLSGRITQNANKSATGENDMAKQMNMMMNIMPIMSIVMCFSMVTGLGIYWIVSAVVRTVQMIFVNKSLNKQSIDALIEANRKKVEKKLAKKKDMPSSDFNRMAQTSTRSIKEKNTAVNNVTDTYKSNAKAGSLASKANMVRDFNNESK